MTGQRSHGRPRDHPDAETRRLDEALCAWMREAPAGFVRFGPTRAESYGLDVPGTLQVERRFEELALELFAYQYERAPVYRAYARSLGRTPSNVRRALDVPALPVEALRRARVATFPPHAERVCFHTSGTTGAQPGVLHLDTLDLYEVSLERAFKHHVIPDTHLIRMLLLVPEWTSASHSSLGYMLHRVRHRWGTPASAAFVRDGVVLWQELRVDLERAAAADEPVCLLGTAFAWVRVLDACSETGWSVRLPAGSRILETGGYKGRSREVSRQEMYGGFEDRFGVPRTHVVGEYGMSELGSQYYTLTLRSALRGEPAPPAHLWSAPAWLRARLLDLETGECRDPAGMREIGLLTHHDLANRSSAAHLLCADLGVPHGASFALRGRCPRADLRGCGLVYERSDAPGHAREADA